MSARLRQLLAEACARPSGRRIIEVKDGRVVDADVIDVDVVRGILEMTAGDDQ